jgi:glycosyltransferase involved in cell wall biosynthesis
MKDKARITIHNGIDTETYSPVESCEAVKSKYGLGSGKLVLGVANIWEPRKGLTDFVKLRQSLSDEYTIALVGLSPAQIADLPQGIIGIERTQNVRELAALYTAADLLFNPTYEDNFPTVNLEAMACGTPVITYDTGGCAEAVSEDTGAVVPKGDLEAAIVEIERICAEAGDRCSEKCRNHIKNNFDMNSKYLEYIEIYNNLI